MPVTVDWVCGVMEQYAPKNLAYDWDNVGLLLGNRYAPVNKILIALELTEAVLLEALSEEADIIVTHHPIMLKPINRITNETILGNKIITLLKNEIALYTAHTNLDITPEGTNDTMFEILGLCCKENLFPGSSADCFMGKAGMLMSEMRLSDFLAVIKARLSLQVVSYVGNPDKVIKKVGLCTGSGSDIEKLTIAKEKGCDVYICGDVTYHNAQAALEMELSVIDGTHFATEVLIGGKICERLSLAAEKDGVQVEIIRSKIEKPPLSQG